MRHHRYHGFERLSQMRIHQDILIREIGGAERDQIVQPLDELTIVNSGLEEAMVTAYHRIRDTMLGLDGVDDLRTAAFHLAIDRVSESYLELGVFPPDRRD